MAFGEDDDHRLKIRGCLGDGLERPDYLIYRGRRDLFELELEHGPEFIRFAFWEVNDAEINLVGGQPGNVEARAPEFVPAVLGVFWGDDEALAELVLGGEVDAAVIYGELPQA
jgi:hypothetical protein